MRPGEQFELRCCEYLKKYYETGEAEFYHMGGMDSTKSDIAVIKNGDIRFYIEAKDTLAQSGQFVLLPDEERGIFVFSPKNRSKPNELTDIIVDYMNDDFDRFNHAGTKGVALDIDTDVFAKWIVEYYIRKNVKYVISYDGEYVIFPIRQFARYFKISAKYRIKKSGSGEPAKRSIPIVTQCIRERYASAKFRQFGKKLFADISERVVEDKFEMGKYTYYLAERGFGEYEVRKLSNTYNMNVIFSVELKRRQDENDLEEFKYDIYS